MNIKDLELWCKIDFDYSRDWDEGLWLYCTSNPLKYAHNLYLNGSLIKNLVIPGDYTLSEFCFIGGSFNSITISEGVTSIADGAFERCENISRIVIPRSVTSIGNYAFYGCSNLTSLIIPKEVETIKDWAVAGTNATLYCEASKEPIGWYLDWNITKRPVYWGQYYG